MSWLDDRLLKNLVMDIYCADIGSITSGNFGWYGLRSDGTAASGQDIEELAGQILNGLNATRQVALGFEAPMFVPFRTDPETLTRKRKGETDKNWIGGPGATVLATALVQVPWLLTTIRAGLTVSATATTRWEEFHDNKSNLFLWEAFVSGASKGRDHIDDARIAVELFRQCLPDPSVHNVIHEESILSLLGASLLRTGWTTKLEALKAPTVVIRPASKIKTASDRSRTATTVAVANKRCPECGHRFKGLGWGGIDAHWKALHSDIMSYEEAWPIIKRGQRPSTKG